MKALKKTTSFLSSMSFALILLAVLVLACIAGSVIPQGEAEAYYIQNYNNPWSSLILLLKLDDVFHCLWFTLLTIALCLNLLMCNLLRFPAIIRRIRACSPERFINAVPPAELSGEIDIHALLKSMGFRDVKTFTTPESYEGIYSARRRIGFWGAWLTHLGILIIIIGFALGQITAEKYTVYGVAGQTKPLENTGLSVTINSFDISLREDETVEQYISNVTLWDSVGNELGSGNTSVNHPLNVGGRKIYQNSTGWAADVRVFHNGELVQTEIVCAGEYTTIDAVDELYVVFRSFYPDYIKGSDGLPATASGRLKNPAYLYMLYYGDRLLGMNTLAAGEQITVDEYTIDFSNPRPYSLLQFKTDRFTGLALVGGIIIAAALVIAFYLPAEELWAYRTGNIWSIGGNSPKGGILFKEKLRDVVSEQIHNKKEQNQ